MPSVTINFSAAHATRLQTALAANDRLLDENGAPRAATIADLKAYIVSDLKQLVRSTEQRAAARAAAQATTDIDIT